MCIRDRCSRDARKHIAVPVRKLSVYLQPFCGSLSLECALQPKVAQINLKTLILEVQGLSKSSLIQLKSSSLVLVVIGSIPMSICNRFHERQANNGKITFLRGYRSLMPSCAGFLEPRKSRPSKSTFSAENFIRSLSMSISLLILAQFALEMCLAARNRQKSIKPPILAFKVIQGH